MNISLATHYFKDEFDLVQGCKDRIPAAQSALYKQYGKSLLILCMRYVGNEEDAKELLTDSFVAAFAGINKFEYLGAGSLQAWLKRIAINQCLMQLRKRNLHFQELKESDEGAAMAQEDVIAQLSAREIMLLIHNLPPGYRTVFNLYVFEEMPHKEIALLLGISESTSKSQLFKARLLLQKQVLQAQKSIL